MKKSKTWGVVIWGGRHYGAISPADIRAYGCKDIVVSWHATQSEAKIEADKRNKELSIPITI